VTNSSKNTVDQMKETSGTVFYATLKLFALSAQHSPTHPVSQMYLCWGMQLKLPVLNRLSRFSLDGTKSNSRDRAAQSLTVASKQQPGTGLGEW